MLQFAEMKKCAAAVSCHQAGQTGVSAAAVSCAVKRGYGLELREFVQRLEAFFAAVSGLADAAERQFHATTGAVVVQEDLAGLDAPGHAQLAAAVAGPDAGDESVRC